MGRAPINPAASRTAGEALLARVDEGRHAAHDRVASGLGERFVAVRASGESSAAGIERKARKDFAQLIAEQVAFEIERVGGGAEALVAGQRYAAFGARPFEQLVATKLRIEEDVSAEQSEAIARAARASGRRRISARDFGSDLDNSSIARRYSIAGVAETVAVAPT